MKAKITVKWKCRLCGFKHKWQWKAYDVYPGDVGMICDGCGKINPMIGDGKGGYRHCK